MRTINVPTINGIQEEVVYDISELPYSEFRMWKTYYKKSKKGLIEYLNIECSFDIETTTITPPKDGDKYLVNPWAFMYHWQFAIKDYVLFGRTWKDFQRLIDVLCTRLELSENRRLVIYVHNLSYEFQFMKEYIGDFTLFARAKRQPMKIECANGMEFRCSYLLSNMSLQKFCENSSGVIHYKLSGGDYDYSKIRYPDTPMTEYEEGYCYNDVRGLNECIAYRLEEDTIVSMPLTSTGYVRRMFRRAMSKNGKNRYSFLSSRLDANQYTMLRAMFRGGNTHANRYLSNVIISNLGSRDESSAYPAVMMMDYFPISKFTEITIDCQGKLDYYSQNYCVIMTLVFKNINCKENVPFPYIDIAHCSKHVNMVNDNGRILSADFIEYSCTEIDLDIIRRQYTYDGFCVLKAYTATRGKLPVEFRKTVMELFRQKTTLKGIEGKEYEYLKSKNRLNSSFGMMVQKIVHDSNDYDSVTKEWTTTTGDIEEGLNKYYDSYSSFLSYQHGVYVTAHARRRLNLAHEIVGMDGIYTDTDSIKYINREKYEPIFEELNRRIKQECEDNDIPCYVEHNGKRYYLGIFEYEGKTLDKPVYDRFITLGAKKYAFEVNDKFKITVSGMSKEKGATAVGSIENFKIGKTYEDIGRTTSWYNEDTPHEEYVDGHLIEKSSNIGILETTYTLGVTNEYWELICSNPEFLIYS